MIGLSKKGDLKRVLMILVVLLVLSIGFAAILSFAETAEEEKLRLEAELAQLELELNVIEGGKWVNISCSVTQIFYNNWNCDGLTGYHTVKVLTSGIHNQRFNFSGQVADAHNLASAQNVTTPYRQFVDDKAADFNLGNYTGTITDGENVTLWNGTMELSPDYDTVNTVLLMHFNNGTGEYEAEINESNVNLILLMHFNNNTGTGENASLFLSNATFNNGTGISNGTCNLASNLCPIFNETNTKLGRAALTFDGTNDYVNTTFNPNARIGNSKPYTVSSWVKLRNVTLSAVVNANTGADRFYIIIDNFNTDLVLMGVGNTYFESNTAILPDIWQHVAVTYDGTDAKIYINGVLDKTQNVGAQNIANEVMKIGTEQGAGSFFNGTMDELAIWNISLSADKIAEHAGAKVIDYSNYKNNGTRVFNITSDFGRNFTAGKFNKGLVFDGVNDYVPINASKTLPIYKNANAYSVSAWINKKTMSGDDAIYAESNSGSADAFPRFYIRSIENGALGVTVVNDAGTTILGVSTTATPITAGVWYHIVWTDNNGAAKLYIDGVQDSTAFNYTRSGTFNNFNTSTIGVLQYNVVTAFYDGTIDELRIMNISLPAEQILRDYFKGNSTHYNNLTGNFTSRVFDANRTVRFDTIMWNETTPRNELVNQSGMVLLLHFNNDSSIGENNSIFSDALGLTNLTCDDSLSSGCPVYNSSSKFGRYALTFEATDGTIIARNYNKGLNTTSNAVTISMWVSLNGATDNGGNFMVWKGQYGMTYGTTANNYPVPPNRWNFNIYNGTNNWVSSTTSPSDNTWYHIAGTYNGSTERIYVNGILENTTSVSGMTVLSNIFQMGGTQDPGGVNCNCTIDELAIYNRSLSAYEIYDHYSRGAERYINMSYRTSADNVTWGSWAYTKNNATLTSITGRYMQYRADFTTNSTLFTPYLENVTINYSVVINLTVWDETDTIVRVLGQPVRFYANFTDIGNNSINGTNINCSFSHNNTGSFSAETNMSFNSTTGIYFIDQQFFTNWTAFYNITCDATTLGYNKVKVLDDFIIYPSLNITVNLNATSTLASTPIAVSGKVNLSNGTNVSNTRIFIYLNGTEQATSTNFTDTSDTDFNKGTFINVSVVGTGSTANITLNSNITNGNSYPNQTGNFTSQTFSIGGGITNWTYFSWNDFANNKYGKDLEDVKNASTVLLMHFDSSNARELVPNGSTVLLMHFNNDTGTGENASLFLSNATFGNGTGIGNGTCNLATGLCPVYNSSSKFGKYALTFDGANDYINLSNRAELDFAGKDFTIEAWVKQKDSVTEVIIEKFGGWTFYFIGSVGTGVSGLEFYGCSSAACISTSRDIARIQVQEWSHIAITRRGSTFTHYVNGVAVDTETNAAALPTSNVDAVIGSRRGESTFYTGTMDEIAVWNISLSQEAIIRHAGYGIDSSQYGNNATFMNATVNYTNFKFGGTALTFDGKKSIINLTNPAPLQIAGSQITLEAWIRPLDLITGGQGIISKWVTGPSDASYLLMVTGNQLQFSFTNGIDNYNAVSASGDLLLDKWQHVAGTYDGTTQSLYLDGNLVKSQSASGNIQNSDNDVLIGVYGNNMQSFNGTIDEVRIMNISLSADEIKRHAMRGLTNLSIYYATSNDTVTWGDWNRATNNTLTTLDMSARYFRYLAKFNTSATNLTPILHDVTINYSGIFTDSFGNYNYTFTALSTAGTYPIKVNATWSNIPGEQSVDLKVIAGPVIQNNYTIPLYPKKDENVTFFINVTDGNGQQDIIWVNFTIIAPNGTKVVNNTNATFQSGSHYNITYNLTSYGTWYWNISVYDTDGFITNSTTGTILLMQITETLNATTTIASRPIAVSGKVNLSNGTNVSNWIINVYVNGTRESTNKTFTDDTNTDFNKGIFNLTNVSGTGGAANVTLLNESINESYTTGDDGQFNDYSSDVATGGTASADSAPNGAAANAFDNDIATYWGAAGEPAWLKYDFGAGNAKKINRITVRTKYGGGADSNRIWAFNGSNNNVDWTTLDNLPDQGGVSTDNIVTIPNFSNNVAYRYYLLNILDTAGGWPGIYEMEMMESIWIAQSFTPSTDATITSVDLYLLRSNSANGSVSVEIQNDNSTNAPNGTIVASPVNVTASSLGTSAGWISFNVGDASLSANTKYWIVLKRTSATAGNVSWRYDGSSPTYTGGESATSSDSGSTWVNDSSKDLLFRTYKGFTSGNFTSQSFDANNTLTWQYISWNNATPVNTNLTLYTRTSPNNATWSNWFQHGTSPSLISQNATNRYLQYLARFNTSNVSITPTLFNVTVNVSLATDSFGNYNYTLTAPSTAGTYPIKVNATWSSIPGEQTVNLGVKNAQTINCQVASCFIVQNSSAGYLAVIDSMGNMNILNVLTQSQEPTADINDFIVQNSTGGLNLVVTNPEGNFLIKNAVSQSQASPLSPTLSAFIVQNRTGAVVAYANSTGGLFLTGTLTDQVLFD